jgi:hypothetical protein
MKRTITLLLFTLILVSCATTHRVRYSQKTLDGFVGKTHQELVEKLGAPTEQVSDGGEGYILVFEGSKELFKYSSTYATKSGTLPKAQFFMNEDGVCQRVRADKTDSLRVTSVGGTIALVILILLIL